MFTGSLLEQLRPYPLLVGMLTMAMFAMHGAMYLYLKISRGELHQRIGQWIWHAWGLLLVLYLLTTIYTLVAVRGAISNFERAPWAAGVVILNVLSVANIPRTVFANKPGQAFLSSVVTIAALVALFGIALWPNLVTAQNNPAYSLTVYRAASSEKTLGTMLRRVIILHANGDRPNNPTQSRGDPKMILRATEVFFLNLVDVRGAVAIHETAGRRSRMQLHYV